MSGVVSPLAAYPKNTRDPSRGSIFGCAVAVLDERSPDQVHSPTVSRVSGSIWTGGLSSLEASRRPACPYTLVLASPRDRPTTDGSSVYGFRYAPKSERRASLSATNRGVRT